MKKLTNDLESFFKKAKAFHIIISKKIINKSIV